MKTLLCLALILMSFSSFSDDEVKDKKEDGPSTLTCKVKKKDQVVDSVGILEIEGVKDPTGETLEVKVGKILDVHADKHIDYQYEDSNNTALSAFDTDARKVGFKKISPNEAIQTDSYFIYVEKSFPASVNATVIEKATGKRTFLKKCKYSHSFINKIISI